MSRITATFENLLRVGRTALIPYLTTGYPQRESALALVPTLVEAGADLIELGIPFSDPLADGPTIQAASQQALVRAKLNPKHRERGETSEIC
jgi:tryptophan synthase alpha chain